MHQYDARRATTETYELAEGPVWDAAQERLLWVDIPTGDIHVGTLHGDTVTPIDAHHVDTTVGAVAPAGEGMLVAGHHDVWLVGPSGTSSVATLIPDGQRRRLNDGKCDPTGRYLVGSLSLGEPAGGESLYCVDPDGNVAVVDDDLQMSNGLAWSPDGTEMYSVDTTPGIIWSRPYDPAAGSWGQRVEAFRVHGGSPDGICIDGNGDLWVAVWGCGEVRQYTPHGVQLSVVTVAAPHTSCVTFAGPDLDRLVITTARDGLTDEQLTSFPDSGALFVAHVDARGVPSVGWKL
jgi:sugar lactone lactonase YvrE